MSGDLSTFFSSSQKLKNTTKKNKVSISTKHTQIKKSSSNYSMDSVAAIILAGGEGKRLQPLTLNRCKPSVPFGGNFSLIDIPISHALSAGCQKVFVITQYLSNPLHHHISQIYHQQGSFPKYIDILTAEQRQGQQNWFKGTADAVRQNLDYILETSAEYFLILSSDQLYNIDMKLLLKQAKETDADLIIGTLPVDEQLAPRLGILKIDSHSQIIDFFEKPKEKSILNSFKVTKKLFSDKEQKQYLGSMGIYLFKRNALIDLLTQDPRDDFGSHLIPTQIKKGKVFAYLHEEYWEDIGTIDNFYKANIALTDPDAPFDLYKNSHLIYRNNLNLPPAKMDNSKFQHTIACEGSIISGSTVSNSILGPRTVIREGCIIESCYLMGNDYYSSTNCDNEKDPLEPEIGKNCHLKKVIVDRNVRLGNKVRLINKNNLKEYQDDFIQVKEGIIVVPRETIIPDGYEF